jgi:hypothetical protein
VLDSKERERNEVVSECMVVSDYPMKIILFGY